MCNSFAVIDLPVMAHAYMAYVVNVGTHGLLKNNFGIDWCSHTMHNFIFEFRQKLHIFILYLTATLLMVAGAGLHQSARAITAGDHCRPCEPARHATCVPRHALRSLEDSRLLCGTSLPNPPPAPRLSLPLG